jgi:hypothetical protein
MKRTYIFAGIILLIFLFGCSRYDDGPAISFRSAKNRVLGTWKVEKLLINDLDSTELYREQIGCEWEFTDELFSENSNDSYVFYYKNCPDDTVRRGLWFFDNTSNEIAIDLSSEIHPNPIGPIGRWYVWDILRLSKSEMHIQVKPVANLFWGYPDETVFFIELIKL